jgi:hypothetical protein
MIPLNHSEASASQLIQHREVSNGRRPGSSNAQYSSWMLRFDSTINVFDPLVVHEYLNGIGNQGGPLVISFNVSSRSELHLHESDNNTTMIALANQGAGFLTTCVPLL